MLTRFVAPLWLFWLWLLPALAAWAQPGDRAPARQLTRFDSLATPAQVQQWLRKQPSEYVSYQQFLLTDSLDQECAAYAPCPGPGASWLKADFDGNGRPDLVVAGYEQPYGASQQIICFLDSGRRAVTELGLPGKCVKISLCRVGQRAALRFAHQVVPGGYFARRAKPHCRIDTLVLLTTGFAEYNRSPRDYGIRQVTFSAGPCYGRCPVFTLQIAADGRATYQARQFNEVTGSFNATLEAPARRELWRLLNYLDFPRLDDNYAVGATDQPSVTLTITYANGKVKTIHDYGGEGTFGLQRVYQLLFALRTSQRWK